MASVRVGLFPPIGQLELDPDRLQASLAGAVEERVDHVCVGITSASSWVRARTG